MSKRFWACTVLATVMSGLRVLPSAHAAGGSSSSTGIASGDFDGDGHDDMAIGVPGEDVLDGSKDVENAGAVNIIYGGDDRLEPDGNQIWHQNQPGVADFSAFEDRYGFALAAGDFDGDGRDDLAVGVPGENIDHEGQAGAVHVLYGSGNGLSAAGDQIWTQNSQGIQETAEEFNEFGAALAAGNLGRGPQDDLVIGVPDESLPDPGNPDFANAGIVHTLYGSNSGLTAENDQLWHQDVQGVIGVAASDEHFGFSLAIADFGRSPHNDLAIGVRRDTSGTANDVPDAGAVNVLYGSDGGLRAKGNQR